MKFTHLHTHSHYSLLQALPKIPELIEAAKKEEMEALALTDNGNMYGTIEFYKECKKAGIKPIIGVDAYLAGRTRFDKQAGIDKDRFRLVLLCKNEKGYKNLLKLVTASYLEGFYYKPRIDFEILQKYSEGLICISSSWGGDISTALRNKNVELANELVQKYKKIFSDNFFIEITKHPELVGHNEHMNVLANFAKQNEVGIVASHDVYYIAPEDREAKNTLMAVSQGLRKVVAREERGTRKRIFLFCRRKKLKRFEDMPEAIFNNQKITSLCNLELELGNWILPNYVVENGLSHDDELRRLTYKGLEERGLEKTQEVISRIEYELKVISDKKYSPYFLVVSDLLRYAKENEILTTTRGSAGGSMVSYLNFITTINPIEFKLPFERFLNPFRPKAPDIDMDIADNRRDKMIEYAKRKHGADKVVQIGTFGTMMSADRCAILQERLGLLIPSGIGSLNLFPWVLRAFP